MYEDYCNISHLPVMIEAISKPFSPLVLSHELGTPWMMVKHLVEAQRLSRQSHKILIITN
jgi:hypothetical protein